MVNLRKRSINVCEIAGKLRLRGQVQLKLSRSAALTTDEVRKWVCILVSSPFF